MTGSAVDALASGVLELEAPTVVRDEAAMSGFGVRVGTGAAPVAAVVVAAVESGMGDLRF